MNPKFKQNSKKQSGWKQCEFRPIIGDMIRDKINCMGDLHHTNTQLSNSPK